MISEETRKLIEENEELVEKNLRRWIAGCKKRMAAFTIPTDEEILEYFTENGRQCTMLTVAKIRKCYEGKVEGKWIDSTGNEVKNWKSKLQNVWIKNAPVLHNHYEKF